MASSSVRGVGRAARGDPDPIWGKVSDVGSLALRDAPPEVAALYRITFERFLEADAHQAVDSDTTPEEFARAVARSRAAAGPSRAPGVEGPQGPGLLREPPARRAPTKVGRRTDQSDPAPRGVPP